jgi:hypothetical protein
VQHSPVSGIMSSSSTNVIVGRCLTPLLRALLMGWPAADWIMYLNNFLQRNGGVNRLQLEESVSGPQHARIWTVIARGSCEFDCV